MRAAVFLSITLLGAPAFAQTVQEQAATVMIADTVAEGFSQEISESIATCFSSRMTNAEAENFLAASDLAAQQAAVAEMSDNTQAVLCVAEVMQ